MVVVVEVVEVVVDVVSPKDVVLSVVVVVELSQVLAHTLLQQLSPVSHRPIYNTFRPVIGCQAVTAVIQTVTLTHLQHI